MVPTPYVARHSIRTEVLLTAFSDALLTVASKKIQWIVRNAEIPIALDVRIRETIESGFRGRLVAFVAD